jgi:hypothetical protein
MEKIGSWTVSTTANMTYQRSLIMMDHVDGSAVVDITATMTDLPVFTTTVPSHGINMTCCTATGIGPPPTVLAVLAIGVNTASCTATTIYPRSSQPQTPVVGTTMANSTATTADLLPYALTEPASGSEKADDTATMIDLRASITLHSTGTFAVNGIVDTTYRPSYYPTPSAYHPGYSLLSYSSTEPRHIGSPQFLVSSNGTYVMNYAAQSRTSPWR